MESNNSSFSERMINPVLKSALKNDDISENCVTYKSVYAKTGLFLLVVLVGVAIAMGVHFLAFGFQLDLKTNVIVLTGVEAGILIVCLLLALIMPIVASFSNRAAAVCGSLACFSYGYILGFMAVAIQGYQGPILLALALTIALVGSMLLLYRFRVVKVTHKFRSFVWIFLLTFVIGSLLMLVCWLIPGLHGFVQSIYANPWLSIGFGALGVILGCLFLLCDFNSIENAVENRLDKQFENRLAFGLAFSVIWLYFKVLDLVLRIVEVTKR